MRDGWRLRDHERLFDEMFPRTVKAQAKAKSRGRAKAKGKAKPKPKFKAKAKAQKVQEQLYKRPAMEVAPEEGKGKQNKKNPSKARSSNKQESDEESKNSYDQLVEACEKQAMEAWSESE